MQTATPTFGDRVRKRLVDNKLAGRKPDSIRSLAKTMADGDRLRFETYKRSLFKWMAAGDPNPSPASRALVSEALGLDRDALNDDDEEADPMAALMSALRRVVQNEMKEKV